MYRGEEEEEEMVNSVYSYRLLKFVLWHRGRGLMESGQSQSQSQRDLRARDREIEMERPHHLIPEGPEEAVPASHAVRESRPTVILSRPLEMI